MKKTNKICILFLSSILVVSSCSKQYKNINNLSNQNNELKYHLSLVMAGDALIHSAVYNDAYVSDGIYDFSSMFTEIKPLIEPHDLAFYNQETIIGGKQLGLSTYPRFNSPDEIGNSLIDIGFNIVSLANNHTLDRGVEAIINSVNYWKSKDVVTSGSYTSFEERNNILVHEKNNIKYAFLAYTTSTNGIKVPNGMEYLVNLYDEQTVLTDINKVKDNADVIIVSMHWGNEYVHEPNASQIEIANYLSSLGVDIIIGHHPHVIQPITFINDTLVVYSLGNLISAQKGLEKLIGMLVSVDIEKTEKSDQVLINLTNVKSELIYTYYKNFKDYKVIPFSKITNDILNDYKTIQNEYIEVIKKYDNTIKVNSD